MIISLIITLFLLYVAYNTKLSGDSLPWLVYVVIVLFGMACIASAIVLLLVCAVVLYKMFKDGDVKTVSWIEDLMRKW